MRKNVYFWQNIYKMATKQYLDAQTIPYQVILREADGSYSDQYPQSFYVSREGNGFRANGGTGDHFLKRDFSAINWKACLPLPDASPTDTEGYMAYLSTLFTGQLGTLVPPTPPAPIPQVQYLYTNPIEPLALTSGTQLFISVSGGVAPSVSSELIATPLFESKLLKVTANIPTNDLDSDTALSLRDKDLNIYATVAISASQIGLVDFNIINPDITTDLNLFYIISVNPFVTGGSITISSIRSAFQLPLSE